MVFKRVVVCFSFALIWSMSAAALHAADSPLADAAMRGDRDTVRSLLKQKVDVNAPQGDGSLRLHAPYGLDELEQGIIRPNANAPSLHRYRDKAESYRARWPFLEIEDD